MRNWIWVFCIIVLVNPLSIKAQKKKENPDQHTRTEEDTYHRKLAIYKQALRYNDLSVATHALYDMISLKPDDNSLKDSLVILYFNRGAYVQAILTGKDVLEHNPENQTVLEIVAISEQNLGALKQALEDYEKLYSLSKKIFHLYQIASLQYALKRYGECDETTSLILLHPDAAKETVDITIGQNQTQKVPIQAAAYNMKGVVALDLGKEELAKELFKKALEIFPEFELAKLNLNSLEGDMQNNK